MFIGRVVLPAAGLVLAIALTWQLGADDHGAHRGDSRGESAQSIAPTARSSGRITAEGRVVAYPGAEVTVGTEVLGTIINMPAREKATVHKGDLLVELRSDDVKAVAAGSPSSADRGRGGPAPRAGPHPAGPDLPRRRRHGSRRRLTIGSTNTRPPSPAATPPRRPSTASRPRRPSTASSHRSTA